MDFLLYDSSRAFDIKKLFTEVFTDSEGAEEGELIGNLAFNLQETTDPEDIYCFVAKDGDTIVGCIFFTRITFDIPINAFILAPVAIVTEYQRRGLGQKLIKYGIDHLKNENVELIFTYGDPDYYSKVDFKRISEKTAKAPFKLTHPEGWLAQSLAGDKVEPVEGDSRCVSALCDQRYW